MTDNLGSEVDEESRVEEKRASTRRLLSVEGQLADPLGDHWFPVKVIDFSTGGIGFLSGRQLPAGGLRMLRVPVPESSEILRVTVRIAHCIRHTLFDGYRVGAEFTDVDGMQRKLIDRISC